MAAELSPSSRRAFLATAQIRASKSVERNAAAMEGKIREAAAAGADCVVFPEMALTGYFSDVVTAPGTPELCKAALRMIAAACAEVGISAVLGAPEFTSKGILNAVVLIDKSGTTIAWQPKLHLVPTDDWAVPGERLITFNIPLASGGSLECGAIICHDIRYPELARLLVLAGARCLFHVSWETWYNDEPVPLNEEELQPYCAQVQARAVENRVVVVHSNVPADLKDRSLGSCGGSKIVDPLGRLLCKASIDQEELLVCSVDLQDANAAYAHKSIMDGSFLADWWLKGTERVQKFTTTVGGSGPMAGHL